MIDEMIDPGEFDLHENQIRNESGQMKAGGGNLWNCSLCWLEKSNFKLTHEKEQGERWLLNAGSALCSHLFTGRTPGKVDDVAKVRRGVPSPVKLEYLPKRILSTLHHGGCHLSHDVTVLHALLRK